MKNKLKVSIGIPAHNEEKHIKELLESIFVQKRENFILKHVIIACDGCSDDTAKIVNDFSRYHKEIVLIDDGRRLGKAQRLNEFYAINDSDILIIFDADTTLGNDYVVNEMSKPFLNKNVMLVGGNDTPKLSRNFVQKMAAVWVNVWYKARVNFNDGVTVNNHKGCASAIRRSFAKKMLLPKEIVGEEDYVYFMVKKSGYNFVFAKKAIVYYSLPATLKDFLVQTTRFVTSKDILSEMLGNWIYQEYKIPVFDKMRALFEEFIEEPIYLPIAVFFQIVQRISSPLFVEKYTNGYWKIIKSSK